MISHRDSVVNIFLQIRSDAKLWSVDHTMSERRFRPAQATPLDLSIRIL
jgi:hypothetical protein